MELFIETSPNNPMTDLDIVAKLDSSPAPKALTVLGADGRSYTLFYRKTMKQGGAQAWKPIKFVTHFPS